MILIILNFLNHYSRGREVWGFIAITSFILEGIALWLQYRIGIKPCVLCIYERCALFGVMVAGMIGIMAPKTPLRYAALAILLYSSWKGIKLARNHTVMLLHPSPFMTCNFTVCFPSWLPLDKWLPQIFFSFGNCSIRQWKFLTLEMPQWLVVIFVVYFTVALLVLTAQFYKPERFDLDRYNEEN